MSNKIPPGFVYTGSPKKCRYCGSWFTPKTVRQVYCERRCEEKHKYDRRRSFRKRLGLCYVCGKEIDNEVISEKTGRKIGYCKDCQKYFKELYRRRKNKQED